MHAGALFVGREAAIRNLLKAYRRNTSSPAQEPLFADV
jgi:hypothetical protein